MSWKDSRVSELLGLRHPIIQAPMAGGPVTVELVVAGSEAGGLGSIGAAMLGPDDLRATIAAVRAKTSRPFAVNIFAPVPPGDIEPDALQALRASLDAHRARLGLPQPTPPPARDWTVADQLQVVAEEHVPVLSFTFGIPRLDGLDGIVLMGTDTSRVAPQANRQTGPERAVPQAAELVGPRRTSFGTVVEVDTG